MQGSFTAMANSGATHAYLAGLFDGEGCVHIGPSRATFALRAVVCMTRPGLPALRLFAQVFGGNLTVTSHRREEWRWCRHGRDAIAALETMRPWLLVKGPHVEVALAFARECLDVPWTDQSRLAGRNLMNAMRNLNGRGPK